MMPHLSLDNDGDVWLHNADESVRLIGPVTNDYLCPPGHEAQWYELLAEWLEAVQDGRDEIALRAQEYYATLGSLRG